ncbi:MAG: penicillin-binding transpeptidase domain-containing protein [Candidatus Cloacimonadales bacterium]
MLWIVQLFLIQVKDAYNMKQLRFYRNTPIKEFINPTRGNIYDKNERLLVTTEKYFQVDIDLEAVEKNLKRSKDDRTLAEVKMKIANLCSTVTGEDSKVFKRRLDSKSPILFYTIDEIKLGDLLSSFQRNNINGHIVEFIGYKRKYMSENIAARLIGNVKESRDTISTTRINKSKYSIEGITGIEASFNDLLNGEFGWHEVIKDANGNNLPAHGLQKKKVLDGYNVYLTIDNNLQYEVEKLLKDKINEYGAEVGMCTIMDPMTGDIVVMAGLTKDDIDTDPALLRSYSNLPVSYKFEPGSTFKPFTMLGAIDYGVYNPKDVINCSEYYPDYTGQRQNERRKITDDHEQEKALNGEEIIAYSSNVGIAKVAEKLGEEKFYQLLRKMGFGQTVPTKLYGLMKGQLSPIYQWTQFSLHSIAFGQEIGVTQLQLANAYAAIANGGYLLKPQIISKITDAEGKIIQKSERQELRRVAKPEVVAEMKKYLEKVFEYGTGRYFNNEIIGLAGKTGTAQVKSSKTKHTNKWEYTSTFVGYLPKDDPKFVIVVTFDKPQWKYRYAATSSLPTFEKVYEQLITVENSNLNVDYTIKNSDMIKMPDLFGLKIAEAEKIVKDMGIDYVTTKDNGEAKVNQQYPEAGVLFRKEGNKVVFFSTIKDHLDNDEIPNFKDVPLRKVLEFCIRKNIKVDSKGKGVIYYQNIEPGTKITDNMKLIVKCR